MEITAFSLTDEKTGESTVLEKVVKDALVKLRIDPKEKRMQAKKEIHFKQKRYQPLEIAAYGGFDI